MCEGRWPKSRGSEACVTGLLGAATDLLPQLTPAYPSLPLNCHPYLLPARGHTISWTEQPNQLMGEAPFPSFYEHRQGSAQSCPQSLPIQTTHTLADFSPNRVTISAKEQLVGGQGRGRVCSSLGCTCVAALEKGREKLLHQPFTEHTGFLGNGMAPAIICFVSCFFRAR